MATTKELANKAIVDAMETRKRHTRASAKALVIHLQSEGWRAGFQKMGDHKFTVYTFNEYAQAIGTSMYQGDPVH